MEGKENNSYNDSLMYHVTTTSLLSEEDLDDILLISDNQLGNGYINKAQLQRYIDDDNKTCLVARTNDTISGFQLMLTCDMDEMMSLVLCEQAWFKKQFSNKLSVGILKTIAVNDKFKTQGIASALTKESIEMLKKKSSCILSICWEQKEDTPISRILERCGMKLTHSIAAYWREDSLKKHYQCKKCGSPPCLCNGLIYQYFVSDNSQQ